MSLYLSWCFHHRDYLAPLTGDLSVALVKLCLAFKFAPWGLKRKTGKLLLTDGLWLTFAIDNNATVY